MGSPIVNKAFLFKQPPHGWPVPGQDIAVEDIGFDLAAPPPKNGFTTKNLYASFDPSQRGRMRDARVASYSSAFEPGKPVVSATVIGKVLKSDTPKVKEGQIVALLSAYIQSYTAVEESRVSLIKIIEEKPGVPLISYIGPLGMTGLTAYGSLHEIVQPKKGEIILVSAAAGAVGQMVGQIALREGLHVIGSVGDDKKVDFVTKQLGFHSAFNYKKEHPRDALQRLAPDGIDVFYDNVGGELLDVALEHLKIYGRIVACGAISQYNNKGVDEAYGVKNTSALVRKRLKWQGFLVYDPNVARWEEERDRNVSAWIADGSFKAVDYVTDGIDNAVDGFLAMLRGDNLGKSVLKIQDP
ncbi:hypothetical protein DV735_g1037, partial [Chaetothyriales sp. CBS 134920]